MMSNRHVSRVKIGISIIAPDKLITEVIPYLP